MHTISFINYKGGVGKTTLTANLGTELAFRGYKVLLIDLDPQASLTFSLVFPSVWDKDCRESRTIKNWFEALTNNNLSLRFADLIVQPAKVNKRIKDWGGAGSVSLVCSHLGLISLDIELAVLVIGANPRQSALNFLQTHTHLRSGLESVSDDYDFIFFDCPANFNISTQSGIIASDFYIIPAIPDYLSILGIDQLEIQVKRLIEDYNHYAEFLEDRILINPKRLGVVFTMLSLYGKSPIAVQKAYIAKVRQKHIPYFNSFIRENKTVYGIAPEIGIPVSLQASNKKNNQLVRAELENFADEFLKLINQKIRKTNQYPTCEQKT